MIYITASDLATLWRIPVAKVYHRAHRAGWRKTRTRPVGYLLADGRRNYGATCVTKIARGPRLGNESGTVCPTTAQHTRAA